MKKRIVTAFMLVGLMAAPAAFANTEGKVARKTKERVEQFEENREIRQENREENREARQKNRKARKANRNSFRPESQEDYDTWQRNRVGRIQRNQLDETSREKIMESHDRMEEARKQIREKQDITPL